MLAREYQTRHVGSGFGQRNGGSGVVRFIVAQLTNSN